MLESLVVKIRFKIALVVLYGRRFFHGMSPGFGAVSTRCATAIRVVY